MNIVHIATEYARYYTSNVVESKKKKEEKKNRKDCILPNLKFPLHAASGLFIHTPSDKFHNRMNFFETNFIFFENVRKSVLKQQLG
jgi:hypothetical protein